VARATHMDKKRLGERVPFVLVEAPGAVTPGHLVDDHDLLLAVQELLS
jgi:3-dehydroquinate synthetase